MTAVDVVIPAFNAGAHIEAALASVAAQSLPAGRVIVVDDGSSDDTAERVQRFAAASATVPVDLVTQANAGPSAARNTGIAASRAPFIAFLDADDLWEPDKLQLQMAAFDRGGAGVGVVYCDARAITADGAIIRRGRRRPLARGDVQAVLALRNDIRGSSSAVVVRRVLFDEVGVFDPGLRSGEDWDLWLRLSRACRFEAVDRVLVYLRQPPGDTVALRRFRLSEELCFLDKLAQRNELADRTVASFRRRVAELGLRIDDLDRFAELSPQGRRAFRSLSGLVGQMAGNVNRLFGKR